MKLLNSYKLLIFLSATIGILCAGLIASNSAKYNIRKTSELIDREVLNLKPLETERSIAELNNLLESYNLPEMREKEARRWMLETLEGFRNLYGAKVVLPISERGSSFTAKIEFSYAPKNPEELTEFLQYLKNSYSPLFHVEMVHFTVKEGRKRVVIRTGLIQPYYGGEYEY